MVYITAYHCRLQKPSGVSVRVRVRFRIDVVMTERKSREPAMRLYVCQLLKFPNFFPRHEYSSILADSTASSIEIQYAGLEYFIYVFPRRMKERQSEQSRYPYRSFPALPSCSPLGKRFFLQN